MSITQRSLIFLIVFFLTAFSLILISLPEQKARFIACDVGQGDAILITKGFTQTLIDGGPRGDAVLSCLSRHVPFWDRTLELVVFTNTDYDHLNGLTSVLTRYRIGRIVTGDGVGESDALNQFTDTLKSTGNKVDQVGEGDIIIVGSRDQLTFHVLWPVSPNPQALALFNQTQSDTRILGVNLLTNTNEHSVVLELEENGYKTLLTGDIGEPTEDKLVALHILDRVDLLKVGHHGSKYSSSLAFLEAVRPSLAIISVGAKNRYGHPTQETLDRLRGIGAVIERTDQEGDIVVDLVRHP